MGPNGPGSKLRKVAEYRAAMDALAFQAALPKTSTDKIDYQRLKALD